jgi:hypothetical protein
VALSQQAQEQERGGQVAHSQGHTQVGGSMVPVPAVVVAEVGRDEIHRAWYSGGQSPVHGKNPYDPVEPVGAGVGVVEMRYGWTWTIGLMVLVLVVDEGHSPPAQWGEMMIHIEVYQTWNQTHPGGVRVALHPCYFAVAS